MPDPIESQFADKRKTRRAKIAKTLRVRPSEPRDEHFEDLPVSVNASKEGIFFQTRLKGYYKGMRVFVTFPFSSKHDPMNCEYVAGGVGGGEVRNKRYGEALQLLMCVT